MWRATKSNKPILMKSARKYNSLDEELGKTPSYRESHLLPCWSPGATSVWHGQPLHQQDLTRSGQGVPSRAAARKVTLPLVQVSSLSLSQLQAYSCSGKRHRKWNEESNLGDLLCQFKRWLRLIQVHAWCESISVPTAIRKPMQTTRKQNQQNKKNPRQIRQQKRCTSRQ